MTAAIAIFAFRRLKTLQQVVSSLEKCPEFHQAPVVFFLDSARADVPDEAVRVNEVRDWVSRWSRNRNCEVKTAPTNMGLRRSITSGVTEMTHRFDEVIVIEDDIVVSPHFLSFMNDGLRRFRDEPSVYQICGYTVPHHRKVGPCGFLRIGTCWGWATWRRAWANYNDDATALLHQFPKGQKEAFDFGGTCGNYADLEANAKGSLNTWAVRWDASIFLNHGLSLLPGISLSRNIGFGEGGTHCDPSSVGRVLARQPFSGTRINIPERLPLRESEELAEAFREFNVWQSAQWSAQPPRSRVAARISSLLRRLWNH